MYIMFQLNILVYFTYIMNYDTKILFLFFFFFIFHFLFLEWTYIIREVTWEVI